jgi:hypothetical protein
MRERRQLRVPEDLEPLIESVYGDGDESFRGDWDEEFRRYQTSLAQQRQAALNARIDVDAEITAAYASKPEAAGEDEDPGAKGVLRVSTRFEEGESVLAVPVYEVTEGWAIGPHDCAFQPDGRVDDGLALRLFRRQVRIGRWELVRSLKETETPPAFRRHPWLRHLKPLVLGRDGRAKFGHLEVSLDPVLGLVYGDTKEI